MANETYGLLDDPWLNAGIGLLAASINQPRPVNIGQALMGGVQGWTGAQDRQRKFRKEAAEEERLKLQAQLQALQMKKTQQDLTQDAAQFDALNRLSGTLPPDQQELIKALGKSALPYILEKKSAADALARQQSVMKQIAPHLGGEVQIPQVQGVVPQMQGVPEMQDSAKAQFMSELQKRIQSGDPEAQSMATFAIQKGWMPPTVRKSADYEAALNVALASGADGKDIASSLSRIIETQGKREDRAADRELKALLGQGMLDVRKQLANAQESKITANLGAKNMSRTEGQKATDRVFAKDYAAWKATGGIANVESDLTKLDEAISMLESGQKISGPFIGAVPEGLKPFMTPTAKRVRDDVGSVVQKSLRAILGGQFAQKEGEQLLKRSYDESLPEVDNLNRLRLLRKQLADAAQAKEMASEYFEQNGTLEGYRGPSPSSIMSGTKPISQSKGQWSVVR